MISLLVVTGVVAFFIIKRRSRRSSSDVEKFDSQPFAPLASEVKGTYNFSTSYMQLSIIRNFSASCLSFLLWFAIYAVVSGFEFHYFPQNTCRVY